AKRQTPNAKRQTRIAPKLVAISAMALLGLYACQKESAQLPTSGSALVEENVTPRVQAFVSQAVHADPNRDEVLITSDSALWYVEAGLNYSFTNIVQEYNESVNDTAYYSIPVTTDGMVNASDASAAYNAFGAIISPSAVEGTSHVAIVDISSTNNGSSIDYRAVYVVGSGYDRSGPNTNFGANAYFDWGTCASNNCGCGPNNGGAGKAADKQIQGRINVPIPVGPNDPNPYWTNVENWEITAYEQTNIAGHVVNSQDFPAPISSDNVSSGDFVRDYKVFVSSSPNNFSGCFDPTDMRFYTQGTYDAIQSIRSNYVPTKLFAACLIDEDLLYCTGCELYWHRVRILYGKVNYPNS
ncbi:MAG: hypothetical protein KBF49_05190, partial [Flavobacteriales bacterium]|nr:hypothetical protein [Flavobacteriales bacterium]